MADSVHILNGDELDRALLAEALGRTGISDYVERDLIPTESDVDFSNAVVDIPAGKAFVLDNGRDSMLLPDARAGVELATDGVNHLFIYYDLSQPEGERIDFHVDSDGSPPSYPALEIAEIDMGASEVRPQNDTAPIYRRDAETYKGNDLDPDGDGRVAEADEAFLVQGSNVSGSVGLADEASLVQGANVSGQVAEAMAAETAVTADNIGQNIAGNAFLYTDLDGNTNNIFDLNAVRTRNLHVGIGDNSDGLKIQAWSDGDGVLIIPKLNGEQDFDKALFYLGDRWRVRSDFDLNGNELVNAVVPAGLISGTVSSASSAGMADNSQLLESKSRDTILTSTTVTVPSAVLDPDESVWVPFFLQGDRIKILESCVYNDSMDTANVHARVENEAGDWLYQVPDSGEASGTIDNQLAYINGENRLLLRVVNQGNSSQVLGAMLRYVKD